MSTYVSNVGNYLYYHNGSIEDITVSSKSTTELRLDFGSNETVFTGTGFSFNSDDFPTRGTATRIMSYASGYLAFEIYGFGISLVDIAQSSSISTNYVYDSVGRVTKVNEALDYGFRIIFSGTDVIF